MKFRFALAGLGVLLGGCAQTGLMRAELQPGSERRYELVLHGRLVGMCHDPSCLVRPNVYSETHRVHLDAASGKVEPREIRIVRDKWRADVAEVRGLKGRILLGADYVDVDLSTCGRRSSGVEVKSARHGFKNGRAAHRPAAAKAPRSSSLACVRGGAHARGSASGGSQHGGRNLSAA